MNTENTNVARTDHAPVAVSGIVRRRARRRNGGEIGRGQGRDAPRRTRHDGRPAAARIAPQSTAGARGAMEAYRRADRLLDRQDRFGLGIGVDPDLVEAVARRIDRTLLRIARRPAATAWEVRRRARLFVRHRGGEGDSVGSVLAHALERDRKLHGLAVADLA